MNSLKRHKITLKLQIGTIIIAAVLLVVLYFVLAYIPVRNKLRDLDERKNELALEERVVNARLEVYEHMKQVIEDYEALPEDEQTYMYKHSDDETEKIISLMDEIFSDVDHQIVYSPLKTVGNIVQREIRFSFRLETNADDLTAYERGKEILYALTHTGRRSLLNNLSLSPTGSNATGDIATDPIAVSGVIIFYELA